MGELVSPDGRRRKLWVSLESGPSSYDADNKHVIDTPLYKVENFICQGIGGIVEPNDPVNGNHVEDNKIKLVWKGYDGTEASSGDDLSDRAVLIIAWGD